MMALGALVPRDAPENLALFRIVVGVLLLTSKDVYAGLAIARWPAALRVPPEGLGPLLASLPITPTSVGLAVGAFVVAAVLGTVGLWARPAFAVVSVIGLYSIGVGQMGGAIWHTHHLLWFSALLAASPCADALALSAWWRARAGESPPPRHRCYGLPLRLAWILLMLIFFFPGLWKLRTSGLGWIFSDNLRNQMQWKWLQMGGYLPPLRIDRWPRLCQVLAAAAVAFELSFPLLLLRRWSRPLAVAAALAFHFGTWLFMGIDFSLLWPCYVVFFDWTPVLGRGGGTTAPAVQRRLWPCALIGCVLVAGNVAAGFAGQTRGWPFACYPTFQHRVGETMPALRLVALQPDGRERELPRPWQLRGVPAPRAWALLWSVAGVSGPPPAPARLRAYLEQLRRHPDVAPALAGACAVRVDRIALPVRPEERDAPPRTSAPLYVLPLAPAAGCSGK